MKIKWTDHDLTAIRSREFMRGLACLPERTQRKVCKALCATSSLADFRATFDKDRLAFFSPNASVSIPGDEPGYAPGDCCAAPEDPRKAFENEYMLHPLPLAPACPNCQRGRLEERVSHGSHVGFRCVGDIGRGVERCGWKSFDLHNA